MRRVFVLAVVAGALVLPPQAWALEDEVQDAEGSEVALSAAGCRTVDIAKVSRDLFGFVVYRFHQIKRWCWDFPRVTSVSTSTYVSDVDPNMDYQGIVGSKSSFYTWCCESPRSGHYSFRQGKFKNCVLWFPCTRTEYPWVKIRARGDGSYSWATGL